MEIANLMDFLISFLERGNNTQIEEVVLYLYIPQCYNTCDPK